MQSEDKVGSRTIEIDTKHKIFAVLFAEDGKQVLSGGTEGMLRRWSVDDGQEVGKPAPVEGAEICVLVLSPDRNWLVHGLKCLDPISDGKTHVRVWNARTYEQVLSVRGHTATIFSAGISPDSTRFATGGFDKLVFVWNLITGEQLVGPLTHDGLVGAVQFSPDGNRLATASAGPDTSDAKSIRIYDCDNGQLLLSMPCRIRTMSAALAWFPDGRQLYVAACSEVKRFDTSTGSLLNKWSAPGGGEGTSVIHSHNQKFVVVVAYASLSFWDVSTEKQIGTVIKCSGKVWSAVLSPDDDCIATGEENGKVTFQTLHGIVPDSYFTVNLPFLHVGDAVFESWIRGDFTRVEELLEKDIVHPSNPFHHARALAQRALVRARSKQWDMAMDDAKKSIKTQRSTIGHIAHAVAHVGSWKHESAMRAFDLVFCDGVPKENKLLLMIKAIILFECGKHDEAISRMDDLVNIMDDEFPYITVRAQMFLLLGLMSMKRGDSEDAIKLFKRAQEAIPFRKGPSLTLISLMFGWDFDRLGPAIQLHLCKAMYAAGHDGVAESLTTMVETLGEDALTSEATAEWDPELVQKCLARFESNGDAAMMAKDPKRAVVQYSTALSMNPSNPAGLFTKRSDVRAMLGLWEDALKDADEAIKIDPTSPRGHETRHGALHGLQRYDEAIQAFTFMFSLIEGSSDPGVCQLGDKYLSPSRLEAIIGEVVDDVIKISPLVLIDLKNGYLCDGPKRMDTFRSEAELKELVSSMMKGVDGERVQQVVGRYFRYVMLSHVWEGREPSFQEVNQAGSVSKLDSSSSLNEKLQTFCEVAREDGYRWAWSDTCCIDKTISTVLNQSLRMMYKWYEGSAATFVYLRDIELPSAMIGLKDSKWMTRAWTSQELLSPKVVRFYTQGWKPYRGDDRQNHKESPEIIQELADAIGITRETIVTFNPDDLTVRQKLRLASTRNATVEEDVAYSLIGIFKSDIRPDYGEGYAALGHLLEEIVARSGEVTVLDWIGASSPYNSCLPTSLAVYSHPQGPSPAISDGEMDLRVGELKNSVSQTDALLIHDRITRLPPARFFNRRLYLPCIIFTVKRLGVQEFGTGLQNRYRARVPGIGSVEFEARERLSLAEPRKLIFVHPWIRNLRDPLDGFTWGVMTSDDDEYGSDSDRDNKTEPGSSPTSPLDAVPLATTDDYTRALRLVARLQQPFHGLLLQQQPDGEFKRIGAEHEIIIPGIERRINFARDIRVEVVEIL